MNKRTIKFRAYNQRDGMVLIDDLYFFEEHGIHTFDGHGFHQDFQITQFTGCCDHQGRDIYEHDVLEYDDVFFLVAWMVGFDGWYIFRPNGKYAHLGLVVYGGVVVGNIYTSPGFKTMFADILKQGEK